MGTSCRAEMFLLNLVLAYGLLGISSALCLLGLWIVFQVSATHALCSPRTGVQFWASGFKGRIRFAETISSTALTLSSDFGVVLPVGVKGLSTLSFWGSGFADVEPQGFRALGSRLYGSVRSELLVKTARYKSKCLYSCCLLCPATLV